VIKNRKNFIKEKRVPIKTILIVGFLPSKLKKIYYRLKGYSIGTNVKFAFGSIIIAKKNCTIGDGTKFGFLAIIVVNNLFVGNNTDIRSFTFIKCDEVQIGNNVIISENVIIRAGHLSPKSRIKIDNKVHIFPYAILDPSYPITIGEETCIGFYTDVYTHSAFKNILDGNRVVYGDVNIGKRVELTYKVFVAPGVTIGDDVQVAYGSYINKDLPQGVLAAGLPAKVKRTKDEYAPVPSYSEKIKIVNDIINNFCDYITYYFKYKVNAESNYFWEILTEKEIYNISLLKEIPSNFEFLKNSIVIFFVAMPANIVNNFNDSKVQYFDLISFNSSRSYGEIGAELERYFGRYGIRFNK